MKQCAFCNANCNEGESSCRVCGKSSFISPKGRVTTQRPTGSELVSKLAPDLNPNDPVYGRLEKLVGEHIDSNSDHEFLRAKFDVLRKKARRSQLIEELEMRKAKQRIPKGTYAFKWSTKENVLGKHAFLFRDQALVTRIGIEFRKINAELIRELARKPYDVHSLTSRQFEELIAEVLSNHGWETELTGAGPDNGIDIVAVRLDNFTRRKLIVQCKRYSPDHKVGLSIVKELFATSLDVDGSHALLATTSWFTRNARDFEARNRFRIQLEDFTSIVRWLDEYSL